MTKKKTTKKQETNKFTLEDAHNYLASLNNAEKSIQNWQECITTLVHYDNSENPTETDYTKKEQFQEYKDINIVDLVQDVEKVVDFIEDAILTVRDKQRISVDTQKTYYNSLARLTQKGSPLQKIVGKELHKTYNDKLHELEGVSNFIRGKNKPKRANATYPDFTWSVATEEYEKFITESAFTNTQKGRKELRIAVLVGLYILQRPRRSKDYRLLQYWSRKPTDKEAEDKNILYKEKDKYYFSIDQFKTRYRVHGASKEKKQVLPRYIKEVNVKLASLLKDYIKKFQIKDNAKLTPQEKKNKTSYYMFFMETGTQDQVYEDNSFSNYMKGCFQKVFNNRKGISINTIRHIFNNWIAENLNNFNDNQLNQLAEDVGDSPKLLPSNLRYRFQIAENEDMDKTEIQGNIEENEAIRKMVEIEREEGGSVGNVEEKNDDVDEVVSPISMETITEDIELDKLYKKLGEAYMQVKSIELMIQRKLSMGV
jgi:hypothetical protein